MPTNITYVQKEVKSLRSQKFPDMFNWHLIPAFPLFVSFATFCMQWRWISFSRQCFAIDNNQWLQSLSVLVFPPYVFKLSVSLLIMSCSSLLVHATWLLSSAKYRMKIGLQLMEVCRSWMMFSKKAAEQHRWKAASLVDIYCHVKKARIWLSSSNHCILHENSFFFSCKLTSLLKPATSCWIDHLVMFDVI